ncbi:hypothetical protein BOTNAR_0320g00100 [Botryotinia narcissicola]|uniref:Uncharacterized protein n=1 Tax=Botryotinia narcissicola TaxID=278944 RepID=A0A4Z1I7I2_9HELO|nr:hypothetical protein BOTNAR_0320g00100 [Botryotinia narcissicola]
MADVAALEEGTTAALLDPSLKCMPAFVSCLANAKKMVLCLVNSDLKLLAVEDVFSMPFY